MTPPLVAYADLHDDPLVGALLELSENPDSELLAADAARAAMGHELDAAMKKLGKDQLAESEAALLYQRIKDSAAQAALHAGHAATVQGDYRSALAWANTVLQIDAGNADAKAFMKALAGCRSRSDVSAHCDVHAKVTRAC